MIGAEVRAGGLYYSSPLTFASLYGIRKKSPLYSRVFALPHQGVSAARLIGKLYVMCKTKIPTFSEVDLISLRESVYITANVPGKQHKAK